MLHKTHLFNGSSNIGHLLETQLLWTAEVSPSMIPLWDYPVFPFRGAATSIQVGKLLVASLLEGLCRVHCLGFDRGSGLDPVDDFPPSA